MLFSRFKSSDLFIKNIRGDLYGIVKGILSLLYTFQYNENDCHTHMTKVSQEVRNIKYPKNISPRQDKN